MTQTLAFLGLGRMGRGMAKNLLAAGYALRVWNRSPGKSDGLEGATVCTSVREAVAGASLVITSLADDRSVDGVVFGDDGVLAHLARDGVHVGTTTGSVELARRLEHAHHERGQHYVAAPVFGRPDAAEAGKLWIVPGGAPDAIARCQPLFAAMGQGTFPMDSPAHAAVAKLVGNFMIAASIETLAEGLALGEKSGIDPERLLAMLTGTLFGSAIMRSYGARIATTDFGTVGFSMELGLKDVTLALRAGEEVRVPLPIASLARDHLLSALARGHEPMDWAGFATVVRESAGLPASRRSG